MGVATGIVVAGKIVVEGLDLPEGSTVTILTSESEGEVRLSSEEEDALLEAMAEADRGETISAEEVFARLDRNAAGSANAWRRKEPCGADVLRRDIEWASQDT